MPRKNLYFTDEQIEKMARLHEKTGLSMSEIARRAIFAFYLEELTDAKEAKNGDNNRTEMV